MKLSDISSFSKREKLVRDQKHWIEKRVDLFTNEENQCLIVSDTHVQFFCTMVSADTTWVIIPFDDFIRCDTKEKVIAYWEKKRVEEKDPIQISIASDLLEDFYDDMRDHYEGSKP